MPRTTVSLCQSHQPYIRGTAPASQAPEGSIHTWSCQLQQVRAFEDLEQCSGCLSHTSTHVCNVRPSRRWRAPRATMHTNSPRPTRSFHTRRVPSALTDMARAGPLPVSTIAMSHTASVWPTRVPTGKLSVAGGQRARWANECEQCEFSKQGSIPATLTAYSVGGLRVCAARDTPQVDGSISTTSEAQATLGIAAHNHRCLDWQHGNAQHGSCVPSEGASGLNLESAPPGGCGHLVTRCVLYGGPQ